MKLLLLSLFFIGIIITIIGFYMNKKNENKTKIIYKFLDQNLEESQKGDQESLVALYETMFNDHSILT